MRRTATIPASEVIAPSPGLRTTMYRDGDTGDIIRVIQHADRRAQRFVLPSGLGWLRGSNDYRTCENVFWFVKNGIGYQADPRGWETVRSPANLFQTMRGDCKSLSIAVGALLRGLGIPFRYRFAAFRPGPVTHVYVVAHVGGRDVVMDTVHTRFDEEPARILRRDDRQPASASAGIAGIGSIIGDSALALALLVWIWFTFAEPVKTKKRRR